MKKWMPLVFVLMICVGLLSGCKEGWTPPPEEEATGDITLSGSKWNGKVAVTMVLHPDGTVDTDLNGEKDTGTWEAGSGDIAMVAHIIVKDSPVDIEIVETDEGYSAEFTPVPDFVITGSKAGNAPAAKDITLSGSKWNGKVAVTLVLHPDGTVDTDLNGEKDTGTWEAGTGEVAMVAHITVKGEPVDIEITDEGESYSAVFTPVPDFVITGSKAGGAVIPTQEPEETDTPTEEPTATPGPVEYPENSLVLDFTPDISEQLQKMFYVESSTWGPALGASGDYAPTESEDELFAWITTGSSVHLTLYANGTYKYEFTTMNIEETGTWTFEGYKMTLTTPKGAAYESTIAK